MACILSYQSVESQRSKRGQTMKWVTRKNANVDRVACPWLIKKFVDPDPEFLYVPTEEVMAVAEREDATPYDVKGVELGHIDGAAASSRSSSNMGSRIRRWTGSPRSFTVRTLRLI